MNDNIIYPIAVAPGDGIGPEIMEAVLRIFNAAEVPLSYTMVEMGKHFFDQGHSTGMTDDAKKTIEALGILFKGPMETPKGKGVKSINVTARKVWNTYANKRMFKSLHGVETVFSKADIPIDITIVRENIEDTYGGIEHMLTQDVALCRRFITREGSLQLHRYAFEMAQRKGSKKITCGHKANIMKLTDGMFLETFYQVAKEFPKLQATDIIVDDLAMKLVSKPNLFDVVVLPNLQGDIISDLCAGLVGGLGFAPSANIGDYVSIFEAVHGTAPDIAGQKIANPTSLLLSGIMMLRHIGYMQHAAIIENALLATLEKGSHTSDFGNKAIPALNTDQFADAIINALGTTPKFSPAAVPIDITPDLVRLPAPSKNKMMFSAHRIPVEMNGVDLFVESTLQPSDLANVVNQSLPNGFHITTISNRGTQVWPTGSLLTELVDQYRVRIEADVLGQCSQSQIISIQSALIHSLKLCSAEFLMLHEGKPAYSLAQGQ